jgi:hypothetical protein
MTAAGGCLCGAVRYEVDGSLGEVRYCHCNQCRRATGTAFTANARIPAAAFHMIAGAGSLGEYRTPRGVRAFCSVCASPIFARVDAEPEWIRVRIGGFAGELDVRITAHVWVASKSSWYEIADALPQYPESVLGPPPQAPETSGAGKPIVSAR